MTRVFVHCDKHGFAGAKYDESHSGMARCIYCGALGHPIFDNQELSIAKSKKNGKTVFTVIGA